jgi:hypothetical protein
MVRVVHLPHGVGVVMVKCTCGHGWASHGHSASKCSVMGCKCNGWTKAKKPSKGQVAGSYMVDAMLWFHETDVTSLFLSLFS